MTSFVWISTYKDDHLSIKYFPLRYNATFTSRTSTGTSTNATITDAKASPELIPKTAIIV
jgi:hypothetical protein